MVQIVGQQTNFSGGIADSVKVGTQNSVAFLRGLDHRTDASSLQISPKAIKDSGSTVTDFVMWGVRACDNLWFYGDSGNLYKKNLSGTWSLEHTAGNSSGNGLAYFGEDGNLYYAQDKTIGRLTRVCEGDGTFTDDFLGVDGGDPTNTRSLDCEADSSQYAYRADTASLSITGDLTLEAFRKPESLPSTGNSMTFIAKWDASGTTKSYKMDITTASNFFGDGSDGALTISTNTTEAPIDSACSGTVGTTSLSATNASFAAGQRIGIYEMQGANAGVVQYTEIASYTAGTITTVDTLDISFSNAQVRVIKQHTNVTINSGITYTAKAWDGTVGGILAFYLNGTLTCPGIITASGKGFRGGIAVNTTAPNQGSSNADAGYSGEGTGGASTKLAATGVYNTLSVANGNGGGAGSIYDSNNSGGGGGGGNGTSTGYVGTTGGVQYWGRAGSISGDANLVTKTLGGGGGSGGDAERGGATLSGAGGNGGGIIDIFAADIAAITGNIYSSGGNGGDGIGNGGSGGGGGAGGSIHIKTQTAVLGDEKIVALGGAGGSKEVNAVNGYEGGSGRVHIDYLTSYTGTSLPALTASQDSSLATGDGYVLRLLVSDDGTTEEIYTWDVTSIIAIGTWTRWQISWDSSASLATFYANGVELGTKVGSMTSIHDNASQFSINADKNSGGSYANFFDGLSDDDRVWNDVRTSSELLSKNTTVLTGVEPNLVAHYEYEEDLTDSQTSGNNDLTGANSPTYSTDVPFSGITARNDQDQAGTNNAAVAGTYTLETSISEDDTKRVFFVPQKDPQESIILKINTVGSGNWTVVVHDPQNRELATVTVSNGDLATGFYEFTFDSTWRPVRGATYHFHVTSTVADGIINVKTGESTPGGSDQEQFAYFTTHYQFLVDDVYHPCAQIINKLAIANERYLATLEGGDVYDPHTLILPSGYRIRSLAYWREYLAIGVWRTKSTTPSITDYDEGYIFFWDGIADTYNYFITVPEGGINSMYGTSDVLYAVAGYSGDIVAYTGGGSAQKIKKIPKITPDTYVEVAPGSMNMWRTLLRVGVNFNTDSEVIEKGVYSFGTLNRNYQHSLGFEHPLSLGTQTSSNVKTSMVFPSGQSLYVAWQNATSYGVDKIAVNNDPYEEGSVELLVADMSKIAKLKYPITLRADFEPLASGQSMRLKYKADRDEGWTETDINDPSTYLAVEDTVGATDVRLPIVGTRAKELQIACDMIVSGSGVSSPKLLGISVEQDPVERARKT